jgi:hypothetical protein
MSQVSDFSQHFLLSKAKKMEKIRKMSDFKTGMLERIGSALV